MNIFHLSDCPTESAIWQHDKHVVKMVLETAQLLSQAIILTPEWSNSVRRRDLYRVTHRHHPSARWARKSVPNLYWLAKHGMALSDEYSHRFWRAHKSRAVIKRVLDVIPSLKPLDCDDLTRFEQAMPDKYKDPDNPVTGYRNYYLSEKVLPNSNWTNRRAQLPDWLFYRSLDV